MRRLIASAVHIERGRVRGIDETSGDMPEQRQIRHLFHDRQTDGRHADEDQDKADQHGRARCDLQLAQLRISDSLYRTCTDQKQDGQCADIALRQDDDAEQDKAEAVKRLEKYLKKEWYRGHSDLSWHDDHKYGINHDGYWCFESGALVKVLGLDDSSLKGLPYYPYDMVHWNDNIK